MLCYFEIFLCALLDMDSLHSKDANKITAKESINNTVIKNTVNSDSHLFNYVAGC